MELGDSGSRLVFRTPDELKKWNQEEQQKWEWVSAGGSPITERIIQQHNEFQRVIVQRADEWRQFLKQPQALQNVFGSLTSHFERFYKRSQILNSTNPAAEFIFKLKEQKGPAVAVGAYAAIINAPLRITGDSNAAVFEGIVEGFLFKREVDWTASAHQETLNRLKCQYDSEIVRQNKRFDEIQEQNRTINEAFGETLKEQADALQKLHEGQAAEFKKLAEQHIANLKAIENAYDQKLALQKPVEYWDSKEKYHEGFSKKFAKATLGTLSGIVIIIGVFVWWCLKDLGPYETPKHWQIGLFGVVVFFSIWLLRVLARLFLSHLHLKTDAAERRTLILTYLALCREGQPFAPNDKQLILKQVFRSVSDGLVKDDGEPPTPLGLITRKLN